MMELGNLVFGNSRGGYRINRSYEGWFSGWLELRGFDGYGHGKDYDEGVNGYRQGDYIVRPYYWGDCTCGFDEIEGEWSEKNKHEDSCYQILVKNENRICDAMVQIPAS